MKLIIILGPTASGKTKLAAHLAAAMNGEVISADSRQVYRRMNVGTGKDLAEYEIGGKKIPYHLIDICEPGEEYNVAEFLEDFEQAYDNIVLRNKQAILCGGTGFYISGALNGYAYTKVPPDPDLRKKLISIPKEELILQLKNFPPFEGVDISTKKRLIRAIEIANYIEKNGAIENTQIQSLSYKIYGLDLPREIRRERITKRLKERLEHGLVEEVKNLLAEGISAEQLKYYGLEYKFTCEFLEGKFSFKEYYERLEVAIHQYAKRQMTWFRKMEKDGYEIEWLNALDDVEANVSRIVSGF